jgi:hypothetical protein
MLQLVRYTHGLPTSLTFMNRLRMMNAPPVIRTHPPNREAGR